MKLAFLALLCVVIGCADPSGGTPGASAPQPPLRIAVFGDMPYHTPDDPSAGAVTAGYERVLAAIAAEPFDVVVHIGAITHSTCTDSVYALRHREFMAMPHPLVYTFGDNEWVDCRRGGREPLDALAKLREVFTAGDLSLGARRIPLARQCAEPRFAKFRENVRWSMHGVTMLTLHVTGTNNARGGNAANPPAEFAERDEANLAWLREGFEAATRDGSAGVAVFMQANPHLFAPGNRWTGRPRLDGFRPLLDELQRLAVAFGKPVALVHGDTHTFRVDQPFTDSASGRPVANLTRAETFGTPNLHALRMTADRAAPGLFRFEPLLVPGNSRP